MSNDAGYEPEYTISTHLDLRLDSKPIRGRLRTEDGAEERFVGWLGFVDALQKLARRTDER